MKIATVFYDKRGILVKPPLFWNKPHPTASVLSLEGGYWHLTEKDYCSAKVPGGLDSQGRATADALRSALRDRDIAMELAMNKVEAAGGTVLDVTPVTLMECANGDLIRPTQHQVDHRQPGDDVRYRWRMLYVLEEPDRIPFVRFAARIDRIGVDPEFVYPYDGVAEQGPDYRTPQHEQEAYKALYSSMGSLDEYDSMSDLDQQGNYRAPAASAGHYPDY